MGSAASFLQAPCSSSKHENPTLSANDAFFHKEKIQATLIHLEKEKFPCSAETGNVGRPHPTRRLKGMPEAGGQWLVSSQSSRLDSSAFSPVSTRAPAAGRPAQRRLAEHRLRVWGKGGAAGTGCPMEMGFGELRKRESRPVA